MLWVDKHRPMALEKLKFHDDLTEQLKRISAPDVVGNMSHLLFYGPSGAGKKTRVMALLREVISNITSFSPLYLIIRNFRPLMRCRPLQRSDSATCGRTQGHISILLLLLLTHTHRLVKRPWASCHR